MEIKDTNPKLAVGIKKVPMSNVPTGPLYEVGLAMLEGSCKYGRHNYRAMGVRGSTYYDAAMRHLTAWWEGENIDSESGVSHIVKAMACLFVLRDSMWMDNWTDDRPPQYPEKLNVSLLNEKAAEIIEKFPEPKEAFTQGRNWEDN